MTLPAASHPVLESQPSRQDTTPDAQPARRALEGPRVLIVDDEPDAISLMKSALGDSGAAITTAASTPEALALLERLSPDVIVADIGMPGEDGYALIRKLRQGRTGQQATPAIAVTAYARPQGHLSALQAGYQLHVGKLFEPVQLVMAVATLATRTAGPLSPPARP